MRDIRQDIQQRIDELKARFEADLSILEGLLAAENARFNEAGTVSRPRERERAIKKSDLRTFLLNHMETPIEKAVLVQKAKEAGFIGRAVSFTLVNLERGGSVEKNRDGKYVAAKN